MCESLAATAAFPCRSGCRWCGSPSRAADTQAGWGGVWTRREGGRVRTGSAPCRSHLYLLVNILVALKAFDAGCFQHPLRSAALNPRTANPYFNSWSRFILFFLPPRYQRFFLIPLDVLSRLQAGSRLVL